MKIIEYTVEYEGCPIKIRDGKIYIPAFETDEPLPQEYYEVSIDDLTEKLVDELIKNKFIEK